MTPDIRFDGDRRVCHEGDPWTPEKGREHRMWCHPESDDDGGCSEGCCDDYRCRVCGKRYRIEARPNDAPRT